LITIYSFALAANAQTTSCKADGDEINDVLDSRIGQTEGYIDNATLGVLFLLKKQCDSALICLNAAKEISPNPAITTLIESIEKSKVIIQDDSKSTLQATDNNAANTAQQTSGSNTNASQANGSSAMTNNSAEVNENSRTAEPVIEKTVDINSIKSFTKDQLAEFQEKGLDKVKRLTQYLDILCQKSTSSTTAINTVTSALSLFDSEDHTVEVSSVNHPDKSRFPVRTYLNRLRMMSYNKVDIKGASFTYVSDFRKGPDGNYYSIARFRQTFTGYVDNVPTYSDITTKTVAVVLKPYQKASEGESIENWDVFLGDIMVTQTEKN